MGIYRPSPINQEHNLGWFLLKRFLDLSVVCSLHITIRNHSNTLLLISMQKIKTLQEALFVLISRFWQFRQAFVHYLMSILMYANKQVATLIKLLRLTQKKNRPEKCLFIATNSWIALAVWWSVKFFFAPYFPLFWKSGGEQKNKKDNFVAFGLLGKRKNCCTYACQNGCTFLSRGVERKVISSRQFSKDFSARGSRYTKIATWIGLPEYVT